eukprot:scaffold370_cov349-Pavlova_lutheri.AAC.10
MDVVVFQMNGFNLRKPAAQARPQGGSQRIDRTVALPRTHERVSINFEFHHSLVGARPCSTSLPGARFLLQPISAHDCVLQHFKWCCIGAAPADENHIHTGTGILEGKAFILQLLYHGQHTSHTLFVKLEPRAFNLVQDVTSPRKFTYNASHRIADQARVDVVVGVGKFTYGCHVDPPFVCKSRAANVRIGFGRRLVADVCNRVRKVCKFREPPFRHARHAHLQLQVGCDGDEIRVPGPFSDSVDAALHDRCPGPHRCQAIRNCHSRVIVRVNSYSYSFPRCQCFDHHCSDLFNIPRQTPSIRFAQHHRINPGFRCSFETFHRIFWVVFETIEEMFCVQHDLLPVGFEVGDAVAYHVQIFFSGRVEHVYHLFGPGLCHHGDDGSLAIQQRLDVRIILAPHILPPRGSESGQFRHVRTDTSVTMELVPGVEERCVFRIASRPTRFYVSDAELEEALCDFELVLERQGDVHHLGAVS